VAVPSPKLRLLRRQFKGSVPDLLRFASINAMGRNPAWIIPAWADFVGSQTAAGQGARGIGEPIWPGRSAQELVECGRHEALLNLAFADAADFTLLCPYDTAALEASVISEAIRNHPHISSSGVATGNELYQDAIPASIDTPLPPRPRSVSLTSFGAADLRSIRQRAAESARAVGCSPSRTDDFTVAVSEACANSIRHAGGSGKFAIWSEATTLVCEIRDRGRIDDPLAGRIRPRVDQFGGRGLWLMHQLCDLVQIRTGPQGQVIRLRVAPDEVPANHR
jgi:anti-sigma regulatory factor (Ser/Thr protein kinase)